MGGAAVGSLLAQPWNAEVVLCWFRRISGFPCPGCGLTRSVISLARGELVRSLEFHPFGVLVLPWAVTAASFPLWPTALRRRAKERLERTSGALDRSYRLLVFCFVGYGTLRLFAVALGYWPSG